MGLLQIINLRIFHSALRKWRTLIMYKLSNLAAKDFEGIFEYTEIAVGVRRHNHSKHAIFYRYRTDDIFVIRILHQQMEPLKHFYFE